MKLMKKAVCLTLVMVIICSLCACGGKKSSGVLIEDLQRAVREMDDDGILTVTEEEGGFTCTYDGSCKLTASADKDRNLTQITVESKYADVSYFDSLTVEKMVSTLLSGNAASSLTGKKIEVYSYLSYMEEIVKICAAEGAFTGTLDIDDFLLSARNTTVTNSGWSYMITSGESIVATVVYVGE